MQRLRVCGANELSEACILSPDWPAPHCSHVNQHTLSPLFSLGRAGGKSGRKGKQYDVHAWSLGQLQNPWKKKLSTEGKPVTREVEAGGSLGLKLDYHCSLQSSERPFLKIQSRQLLRSDI